MKIILTVCCVALLSGCGLSSRSQPPELKSPCVGAENSPCDRRPANAWLYNA